MWEISHFLVSCSFSGQNSSPATTLVNSSQAVCSSVQVNSAVKMLQVGTVQLLHKLKFDRRHVFNHLLIFI